MEFSVSEHDADPDFGAALILHGLPLAWCVLIGWLSIYPGVMSDLSCGIVLLLLVGFVASAFVWLNSVLGGRARPITAGVWALGVILALLAARADLVPRVAFYFVREKFERAAVQALPAEERHLGSLEIGIYSVSSIRSDDQGGSYFVTHSGGSYLGNYVRSDGFAWRPNLQSNPWGAEKFSYSDIGNGWFVFSVTMDW